MIESLRRQNIALFSFLKKTEAKRVLEQGNWPDKVQVAIKMPSKDFKKMNHAKIEENQQIQRRKRVKAEGNELKERVETG